MPVNRNKDTYASGFPAVVGRDPRILILGSLPGQASLVANQYYAMPRNSFWFVMNAICGADPGLAYQERLRRLKRAGIALWDVLHAAERAGSLDAAIVRSSEQANDIAALTARCTSIRLIAFNGQKAAASFRRHIEPALTRDDIEFAVLPSTSPAHAALSPHLKLKRWRAVLMPHLRAV